jgi:hypothetical protein
VDDEIFALNPTPGLGEGFTSITGIHDYTHNH